MVYRHEPPAGGPQPGRGRGDGRPPGRHGRGQSVHLRRMSGEPHLVAAPETMWRVARLGKGTQFSEIDPVDALSLNAGNRFDVVGGGVLYASTLLEGCYREVLARLRPAPGMADLDEDEPGHMRAGNVAASWRENRRRFALGLPDALPFVDVEHQDTWNMIDAAVAMPAGVDHLDVGHVRSPDRLLTRAIAAWVYPLLRPSLPVPDRGLRVLGHL
ncbi:hypothetical protein FNH13_18085 [Ornithinimicrobium ciconiae]|uniref:Uncharacterized protein n=1 Tax=Ornithinimicrobium ciconiae TaxID=2594265 RepID=A0A516GEP1_9MICO|nr:hypothetical protein FNH13_18085 [Ornithinimicrobium ciconiae]